MGGARIGLALQGGGAYAAFTAGVLSALIRPEGPIPPGRIHAVTGTSGGALNAALLARAIHDGIAPDTYLDAFWRLNRMEDLLRERYHALRFVPDEALGLLIGLHRHLEALGVPKAMPMSHFRGVALDMIRDLAAAAAPTLVEDPDAAALPARRPFVTVAATEVHSGLAHLFSNDPRSRRLLDTPDGRERTHTLTARAVLASMAHPMVFDAVRIGDGAYWDGYYTRNPPLTPLLRQGCTDIVLVRLVAPDSDTVPESEGPIRQRVEEIVQNTTLSLELDACRTANGSQPFRLHEIRLTNTGNLSDAAYPLAEFVERLSELGRRAVADDDGFASHWQASENTNELLTTADFANGAIGTGQGKATETRPIGIADALRHYLTRWWGSR
ncbi:patatin-like phospholipase family protein [Arhodomonas aquaeolei]|uniref:patatin-like phospholipase family protein n=1 Tax=Arhodomonas aquaeolei TaxID=2369 RepID=UPI0021677AAF|nr:patatin-like phospholipase family protein [Arhodomonas aquaeolei]MCS4503966.1 patatin-like phospholipase family protein [Arhodomonas aquaeolei]